MSFIQIPIQIYPNTSLGYSSLSNLTSGSSNTAIGYESLKSITSGFENVAVGNLSLRQITTGAGNTAVGNLAISTGSGINNSTAVGAEAMRLSLSGADNNTAIGNSALRNTLTGAQNTAVGYSAGYLISTGSKNTILGAYNGNQGGLDIRTLSNYVVISDGDGNPRIIVDPAGLVSAPGGFSGGGGGGGALTFNNQTAAYTVVSGDLGKIVNCTANTFTVSLTAAATLGSGFNCWIWNTGTGTITIDPNGAETIDGNATFVLRKGQGVQIICTGTAFRTGAPKQYYLYNENYDNTIGGRPTANNSLGAIAFHYDAIATGNTSMAIGFSTNASGENASAIGYRASATGPNSTGLGANSAYQGSQAITGNGAMALGGSYASGTDSFAAAVVNNTSSYGATQSNSVAIGYLARAQGLYSAALGFTCSSTATRTYTFGDTCTASAVRGFAFGSDAVSAFAGKQAYGNGAIAVTGDNQAGKTILKRRTTDATPTALTSDSTVAGASNQVILANNTAFAFTGTIVARQQAAGGAASAAWTVSGLIRREGTAASTAIVASTVTTITNVPGWNLALSADTTNGGLTVTATGAVGTNVQWTATIDTTETTYA